MADSVRMRIGPGDRGRRMSFEEFYDADLQEGYGYEIAKGAIEVIDVPDLPRAYILQRLDIFVIGYLSAHRGRIHLYATEAWVQMPGMSSDRHPDRAIYLSAPPSERGWAQFVPEIVLEVVSPGEENRQRDLVTKRAEYLAAGVREYWIIDPEAMEIVVLRRAGDVWREQKARVGETVTTPLRPGFALPVGACSFPRRAEFAEAVQR